MMRDVVPGPSAPAVPGGSSRAGWLAPAVVLAVTIAAFVPALQGDFVNWDDPLNFLENPHYRGLGARELLWMWTTFHMGHYIPLTWLTLGVDYVLWGMDARGYHATNIALHAATALAFYFLALRLLRRALPGTASAGLRVGAAAGALLFAVHPLRAESVAWITERRDVLSGLFYMLAVIAYLKVADRPGNQGQTSQRGWYWTSLGLFACALLSKSITVTLPVALLLMDIYPLRRLGGARGWLRRDVWLEKLPFFALSAAASIIAFTALIQLGNMKAMQEMSLPIRIVLSVYGLAFYLEKTVLPLGLAPLYQFPVEVTWWHFAIVFGATAAAVVALRRWPAVTVVWGFYLVTLLPVLGIFQNGPQVVADRYSYLACLPFAVIVGAGAARRWAGAAGVRLLVGLWIVVLTSLTWQQAGVWQSSLALWSHAIDVNPAGRAAHAHLAKVHELAGRYPAAIRHYEETLRLSSNKAIWLVALAQVHEKSGDDRQALSRFQEALRLKPGAPDACDGARRVAARTGDAVDGYSGWATSRYLREGDLAGAPPGR